MAHADLTSIAPEVATRLLGDHNKHNSTPRQKRWGKRGSLSLNLSLGWFTDHEAGESFGVLDLVKREVGGNPWDWLADQGFVEARGDYTPPDPEIARQRAETRAVERAKREAEALAATAAKSALAARIWADTTPAEGTIAELYLRSRGITEWPADGVRYHPAAPAYIGDRNPRPAMVVAFKDDGGNVVAIQAVRLTPEGRKITDARAKSSLGPIGAGRCVLAGSGTLHLAEGPETALSVWMATGGPVEVCGGAIGPSHMERLPSRAPVVLCSDPAEEGTGVKKQLDRAVATALGFGMSVGVAIPTKGDWNDVLQAGGVDAVAAGLGRAEWRGMHIPATVTAPKGTLAEARKVVADTFQAFKVSALAGDVRTVAINVTTGVGKSHGARQFVGEMLKELRDRGDMRPLVIASPRHDLSEEYAVAFKRQGIACQVIRGREVDNPAAEGVKMCKRAEEARQVSLAGGTVETALCKSGDMQCPFYETCAYIKQQKAKADVWLISHDQLQRNPPQYIQDPAALIIDEDPSKVFVDDRPSVLSVEDLRHPLNCKTVADGADLAAIMGQLADWLEAAPLGRVTGDMGLSEGDLQGAVGLAYRALLEPPVTPRMAAEAVLEGVAAVEGQNRIARNVAKALNLCKQGQGGFVAGAKVVIKTASCGAKFKALELLAKKPVSKGWNIPTVIASATASEAVLKVHWPDLEPMITATAIMPHTTVHQVTNSAFARTSTFPLKEAVFARNNRRDLHHYIEIVAAKHWPEKVLVTAQKGLIELLKKEGLPSNVKPAWFNALSGRDEWGDVRALISIGRTLPQAEGQEDIAEALTGLPVQRIGGKWPKRHAVIDMGDGEGRALGRRGGDAQAPDMGSEYHPDPMVEALRWSICEGELLQAIGRARGVNRTENTPLDIHILAAYPLPLAVDRAEPWEMMKPKPMELMEARGIIPQLGAKGAWEVVAGVTPDLFPSAEAAKKAFKRSSKGQTVYRDTIGSVPLSGYMTTEGFSRTRIKARLKLPEARYAVPVEIVAPTVAEAQLTVAKYWPEAELLDVVPPKRLVIVDNPPPVALPPNNRPVSRPCDPTCLISARSYWPIVGKDLIAACRVKSARGEVWEDIPINA